MRATSPIAITAATCRVSLGYTVVVAPARPTSLHRHLEIVLSISPVARNLALAGGREYGTGSEAAGGVDGFQGRHRRLYIVAMMVSTRNERISSRDTMIGHGRDPGREGRP